MFVNLLRRLGYDWITFNNPNYGQNINNISDKKLHVGLSQREEYLHRGGSQSITMREFLVEVGTDASPVHLYTCT